ncbi:MAG: sulfotransferase family protein [Nocardioides sp.]
MQGGPELVWIFSSGRSGTTWLMKLLSHVLPAAQWSEPRFGRLFHRFVELDGWREGGGHLLSEAQRPAFIAGVGAFVRTVAAERFPDDRRVIVKEPAGSAGAPLLSAATPESRLVIAVRDLRDVVASSLAGKTPGNWQNRDGTRWVDLGSDEFTGLLTKNSVKNMQGAIDAYDQHAGPKSLVRYEDLLADTPGELKRIVRDLDFRPRPKLVRRAVQKYAWERVPEEDRGEDKFFRKATPGSWSEDLSDDQVKVVEEAGQSIMDRFYGGWGNTSGS